MFVTAAGVRATNEVQIEGRERPADIFMHRWTTAEPVAVDVNARQAKDAAATKERQKVAKYAHLIREKQLNFIPVGVTTFGALGPQATQFVDDAADFYSGKCAMDRGVCRRQLVERLQVALLQEVGKRLLAVIQAGEDEGWATEETASGQNN